MPQVVPGLRPRGDRGAAQAGVPALLHLRGHLRAAPRNGRAGATSAKAQAAEDEKARLLEELRQAQANVPKILLTPSRASKEPAYGGSSSSSSQVKLEPGFSPVSGMEGSDVPTLRAQLREARTRVQAAEKDKAEALAAQKAQHDVDKDNIMEYAE